jgi:hypothetical protein
MNLKLEIRNTLLDYDLRPNSYETLTEGLVRTFQDFLENEIDRRNREIASDTSFLKGKTQELETEITVIRKLIQEIRPQ